VRQPLQCMLQRWLRVVYAYAPTVAGVASRRSQERSENEEPCAPLWTVHQVCRSGGSSGGGGGGRRRRATGHGTAVLSRQLTACLLCGRIVSRIKLVKYLSRLSTPPETNGAESAE
jgi:hypothetical protein